MRNLITLQSIAAITAFVSALPVAVAAQDIHSSPSSSDRTFTCLVNYEVMKNGKLVSLGPNDGTLFKSVPVPPAGTGDVQISLEDHNMFLEGTLLRAELAERVRLVVTLASTHQEFDNSSGETRDNGFNIQTLNIVDGFGKVQVGAGRFDAKSALIQCFVQKN